jgi:nucleotide-binding universal stress UspA family protein
MMPLMPEIKRILYTTDLSKNARDAFGYAIGLANCYNAGIIILHVLEDLSPYSSSLVVNVMGEKKWKELREQNEQKILDDIRERLQNFCDQVTRDVPECPFITEEIFVRIGNAVDEILKEVESSDCDLVVMGAHGHGVLGDAMMGSTSRRVLRRCQKPVLVVRLPQEGQD